VLRAALLSFPILILSAFEFYLDLRALLAEDLGEELAEFRCSLATSNCSFLVFLVKALPYSAGLCQ